MSCFVHKHVYMKKGLWVSPGRPLLDNDILNQHTPGYYNS